MLSWVHNIFTPNKDKVPVPRTPTVIYVGADALTLEWSVSPEAKSYVLRRTMYTDDAHDAGGITQDVTTADTNILVTGLYPNTYYSFVLCAEGSGGQRSDWTQSIRVKTTTRVPGCLPLAHEDKVGHLATAALCCEAVYNDDACMYITSLNPERKHNIQEVIVNPPLGYSIFTTADHCVYIAFRGVSRNPQGICCGIGGDSLMTHPAVTDLRTFLHTLQSPQTVTVCFTGHDEGGLVAINVTCSILSLEPDMRNRVHCITYGTPAVSATHYPRAMPFVECFLHVVHQDDPIPRLPLCPSRTRVHFYEAIHTVYRTAPYSRHVLEGPVVPPALTESLRPVLQDMEDYLGQGFSERHLAEINFYPLGTLCTLAAKASCIVNEAGSLSEYAEAIKLSDFHWSKHSLLFYSQCFEEQRTYGQPRKFGEWPLSLHPIVSEDDPPVCDYLGNLVQLTINGYSMFNITAVMIADSTGGPVSMEVVSRDNHCVVARTSSALLGLAPRDTVPFILEWVGGGLKEMQATLYNHEDFVPPPAYATQYERMVLGDLLQRGLARSFVCDAAPSNKRSNISASLSIDVPLRVSVAARLLCGLERAYTTMVTNMDGTWGKIARFLILPQWKESENITGESPLQLVFDSYLRSEDHNEARVTELCRPVLESISTLLDETHLVMSLDRSNSRKVAIFSAKLAAISGGIALMTPLGPAVAVGAATAGTIVSVFGTSTMHAFDMSRTMPFSMRSYDSKINFLLQCFDYGPAMRHSLAFRELVLYKAVCRSLTQYGEVERQSTILDMLDISQFSTIVHRDWDTFWLSGREQAEVGMVNLLQDKDRTTVVHLLWTIVLVHELRRLLTCEFSLNIVGTKNVGKSTVIQDVFGVRDITCGSRVSQSTVIPVAYKIPEVPNLTVVDQPGSDDVMSMASRINIQSIQLGSHFLVLTDFRAAQHTSFLKLLLAVQCAQARYTIVFTRADEYIEEFGRRDVFESELGAICERINRKLLTVRNVMCQIRHNNVETKLAAADHSHAAGSTKSHNDATMERLRQLEEEGAQLKLELDRDVAEQVTGLTDAQLEYIHEEDPTTWLVVAVHPRKVMVRELERTGMSLGDYGIHDATAVREVLTRVLDGYEAELDVTKVQHVVM
eukprot:PhM_4_TR9223/c0_g1_i1/m.20808